MHYNGIYHADCDKARYHIGAAVAEKGKRYARYGKHIYAHADIFQSVEKEHCA